MVGEQADGVAQVFSVHLPDLKLAQQQVGERHAVPRRPPPTPIGSLIR
jgi:hypothetical protein